MTDQVSPEFYTKPPRQHWLLFPLLTIGLAQALWLHGHSVLSPLIILASVASPWIACIPDQRFSRNQRRIAQGVCAMMGLVWLSHRMQTRTPADLALIEALAIISFAFAFSRKAEEYGFLFLASIIFLIYGACAPARFVYVLLLPPSIILILAYLYTTRSAALARVTYGVPLSKPPANVWWVRGSHLGIVLIVWIAVFFLYPSSRRHGAGMVGVSYETRNQSQLAPQLQKWLPSAMHVFGDNPSVSMDGDVNPDYDPASETITAGEWQQPAAQGQGGSGGTPSEDLVMRVKSPVKLYWVGQLYDTYNGKKWTATRKAAKVRSRNMGNKRNTFARVVVPQTFIIEKWISRSLFAAFDPVGYSMPMRQAKLNTKQRLCGKRILEDQSLPEPPYQYSVRSYLYQPRSAQAFGPSPEAPTPVSIADAWQDPVPPTHYLSLPKKVSKRVRELAQRITHDSTTPLAKATAIRNYLRNTFTYQQFSKKTPPDRETVDYFLFDLKEGHCEYFAASLAVLSRASGVHARVATGFSPGNYNTLSGFFEVHEYHAHAWTQVFIPEQGWITMDATPPGSMQTRNTPAIIGDMRDPFADDWEVTPPEMSQDVEEFARQFSTNRPFSTNGNPLNTTPKIGLISKIAMNFPVTKKELSQLLDKWSKPKGARRSTGSPTILSKVWRTITFNFKSMVAGVADLAKRLVQAIRPIHVTCLAMLIIICTATGIWLPGLLAESKRRRRLAKCHAWWQTAKDQRSQNPESCIEHCYQTLKELLDVAGHPKPHGEDAFDYARSLEGLDADLSRDVLAVVELYARVRYSPDTQTAKEARAAYNRASSARSIVMNLIAPAPVRLTAER